VRNGKTVIRVRLDGGSGKVEEEVLAQARHNFTDPNTLLLNSESKTSVFNVEVNGKWYLNMKEFEEGGVYSTVGVCLTIYSQKNEISSTYDSSEYDLIQFSEGQSGVERYFKVGLGYEHRLESNFGLFVEPYYCMKVPNFFPRAAVESFELPNFGGLLIGVDKLIGAAD
jgi:hypothetical protein